MGRPLRLSQAIPPFLRQMAADGRTPSSIQSYQRELASLTRGLNDVPLRCLTAGGLNGYLTSRAIQMKADGSPKQASTINRVKSVIRAFFGWCQRTGLLRQNPTAHVRLAVASTPVTGYMTRQEVRRFLRTVQKARHRLASRDHALFAALAYTGIRLSDAIGLQVKDLDLRHRCLALRRSKGGRRETRYVPARLSRILTEHLRARPIAAGSRCEPVFVSRNGRPLSARAVQYRFLFWIQRAQIAKTLSVHSLRHTFGTPLYQATKALVLVSRALGHRDVKSTQRHAHLGDQTLATAINRVW